MTPLVLGGDHSLAAGSISGVSEFYRRRSQSVGLVWIDAHSDINTPETSPSGNVHGMPLAALLGLGPDLLANIYGYSPKIAPENTVLIGVRDIDAAERANIKRAGVAEVYTMRDIDERGMRTVMEEALRAAGRGTAGYHVSLDMDWIDPEDTARPASITGSSPRPWSSPPASRHQRSARFKFVGDSEDGAFWTAFLRSLKTRGMSGVQLVISDAHAGLKAAIASVLLGAAWQRCRVH